MFSFTDYCPTFEIQQIVNDGNVAEEKKLCVEIILSDAKVRTYSAAFHQILGVYF